MDTNSHQLLTQLNVVARISNIIHKQTAYRQFSNIRRTQSPNINVSRLILQLSLPNPLKPGINLRMK